MDLPALMAQLAAQLRIAPPVASAEGDFALRLGEVLVNFRPQPEAGALLLQARLGPCDFRDTLTLEALLAANLAPPSPHSGILSLDPSADTWLTLPLVLRSGSLQRLLDTLAHFVAQAQTWQQRLSGHPPVPGTPAPPLSARA